MAHSGLNSSCTEQVPGDRSLPEEPLGGGAEVPAGADPGGALETEEDEERALWVRADLARLAVREAELVADIAKLAEEKAAFLEAALLMDVKASLVNVIVGVVMLPVDISLLLVALARYGAKIVWGWLVVAVGTAVAALRALFARR